MGSDHAVAQRQNAQPALDTATPATAAAQAETARRVVPVSSPVPAAGLQVGVAAGHQEEQELPGSPHDH